MEEIKKMIAGQSLALEIDKLADTIRKLTKDINEVKVEELLIIKSYIEQGNMLVEDIMKARE